MKNYYFPILLSVLMSMVGAKAYAYDLAIENSDGVTIYYNYINDGLELEVTSGENKHSGSIVIPEEVTFKNQTRKITSIGNEAFCKCYDLGSIIIPDNVTSIGDCAFYG